MSIFDIFKKKKYRHAFVEPDEIFLDAKNLPKFNQQQFEGRLERPIAKQTISLVKAVCVLVLFIFVARLLYMQGFHGSAYLVQSEQNQLGKEPLFAERGVIYDRNNVELAWNDVPKNDEPFSRRTYIAEPGFGHLLGYVSYPSKDSSGVYWQTEFIGKDGIERTYNDLLKGQNGTQLTERDVHGTVTVSNQINKAVPGGNITLAIDSRIQEQFSQAIENTIVSSGYEGGAAAMMDIQTGELLALTSIPEYDPNVLSEGSNTSVIKGYLTSSSKPFLNRAIDGLYSPGSIIKPFIAMAALTEGVVTPDTKILAHGIITVPNPYDPAHPTIFRDYRANNGWVDLRHALAYSANIYFYNVGGGFQNQRGIGIDKIGQYTHLFGLDMPTGVDGPNEQHGIIPSPAWKEKNFPGDQWRVGDTYNTAIGQYGVQVTPIEMLRAVASVANDGTLVTPHLVKGDTVAEAKKTVLGLRSDYFQVVREGMRLVVDDPLGTAKALNTLPFNVAAKTGTAQVGANNEFLNSWAMGFFPYEKPRYAWVVLMEHGSAIQAPGATSVSLATLSWMAKNTPEYVSVK